MADFVIKPVDIFDIVKRQRYVIVLSFLVTVIGVTSLKFVVPKTFQAEAAFHIGVNYFHDPLINDLVSQTQDPGELRSEREKIIQSSLNSEFLNKTGEKLKMFSTSATDPGRAIELEWMNKSMDVFPLTATQFRVSYKSNNPETAAEIVKEALVAIRDRMYQDRIATLQQLEAVLETEISRTENGDHRPVTASDPGSTHNRIAEVQKRIDDLRRTYSEQHPSIAALKNELADLQAAGNRGSLGGTNFTKKGIFGKVAEGAPPATIKDDLNKQKHLVNIALEMERKDPQMNNYLTITKDPEVPRVPIFPKLRMFLLFGLVSGVLVSTLLAALREFYQREEVQADDFAKRINAPVFGTIVIYPEKLDHK